ncbi:E3 ubiquitin-protein ligase RBBP6-like [Colius striatus]|uniref:E3 ubiquitin-protein ligase RBBP6-like n=1 Tax=Colius striatus TaxID=57412 RepID=UPI002B1E7909|nr:E3 ubiquitin-protein ligase RBBP6-like [Colius striatus]
MIQSCLYYYPLDYLLNHSRAPPPSYICFRCGQPGHYLKYCPTSAYRRLDTAPRVKRSTGTGMSFMVELCDPNTEGAMLTRDGKYTIAATNAAAFAQKKDEKPPFLPQEPSSSSSSSSAVLIPEELLCPLCKELIRDAAVIPCCRSSYCDYCIRRALLESEEHQCPTCHQTNVPAGSLEANKFLRKQCPSLSMLKSQMDLFGK